MKSIEFKHRESPHYTVFDNGTERTIYQNRAVTMDIAQFLETSDHQIYIVIAERGPESFDFQGLLNMPCGHLDWDETVEEGATRELFEETGFYQPELKIHDISSDPLNNRQNVQITLISRVRIDKGKSLPRLISTEESQNVRWVNIKDVLKEWSQFGSQPQKWAFGHDRKIVEIVKEVFGLGSEE